MDSKMLERSLYSEMSRRDALKLLGLTGSALAYLALDFYARGPISTLISEMTKDKERPIIKRVAYEKYGLRGSPYSVDVEATDNVSVESVLLEVLAPDGTSNYYKAEKVEKDVYRISFIPSLKGIYEARAIAKDTSDNVSMSESFKMISLTETEDRLRSICPSEKIFEKGYELINDLELSERKLRWESLLVLKNYSIALVDLSLPYAKEGLSMLIEASEINPAIVDFEPIVIKDVKGNVINIESANRARDTWMIAYLLKQRPELVEQPKKFEWINRMMQQVAWNIFDNEYGPSFFDKKPYHPTDKDVWDVILGFHDYMDKLPSKMEKDDLPVFFHYWDSDLLEREISNKTNRTLALFNLADLPARAYDRESYQVIYGIDATKLFVKRLSQMYDWVVSAWKTPLPPEVDPNDITRTPQVVTDEYYKRVHSNVKYNSLMAYIMWLQDRKVHGTVNTVRQFSGEWPFEQEGTIDDFLNKNFFAWKFAKFPYAYLRGRGSYGPDFNIPNYGENEMYAFEVPLAYKSVGIPAGNANDSRNFIINSNPMPLPYGAAIAEFGITLPDNILQQLRQKFSNMNIVTGYANELSLYSLVDGLVKDSNGKVEWLGTVIRDKERIVYLWKKE